MVVDTITNMITIIDMDILINAFVEVQDQDLLPASVENFEDSTNIIRALVGIPIYTVIMVMTML